MEHFTKTKPTKEVADKALCPDKNCAEDDKVRGKIEDSDSTDCESDKSFVSVRSQSDAAGKFWQTAGDTERTRRRSGSDSSGCEESGTAVSAVRKVSTAKRSRGRPPTTGQYVGLKKAKEELLALQREQQRMEMEHRAEIEAAELAHSIRLTRVTRLSETSASASDVGETGETAPALKDELLQFVALVQKVETGSRNLKGTFKRHLKDAVSGLTQLSERIHEFSSTSETKRLEKALAEKEAENNRVRRELSALQKEVEDLKQDLRTSRRADKEQDSSIMVQVGAMVNARLEALETRLLPELRIQPSLAVDRQSAARTSTAPHAIEPLTETQAALAEDKPKKKQKRKKKKTTASSAVLTTSEEPRPLPPQLASTAEDWTTVVKRGKKPMAKTLPPEKGPKQVLKKVPKLRPPRSEAVVITLQPGAENKGWTYAKALADAKSKVSIDELGITSVRFRRAVTGAAILELPGAANGDKADSLAEKIRGALGTEDVKVSRPIKCAEMRVSGLDDSVSPEEVVAAVARAGECSPEAVKVGAISRDRSGLGSIWVRCPIAAAGKITGAGRLLVGWVAANVKLLERKQLRCFRCFEAGHVRAQCKSEVDRSSQCYKCGQLGHKAGGCTEKPHCTVCAVAGKPASHKVGGKACAAQKPKKRVKSAAVVKPLQQPNSPPAERDEVIPETSGI